MNCLSGIRVADFTWAGAGAYCTLMSKYLGAEVIKIESKYRPDESRYVQRKNEEFNINGSPLFNEMNLGKRSITINLSKPKGIELAKKLISISDIVAENMRPGVMKKLGLDYWSITEFKPDIIMVSYSLSGQAGSEANYSGYAPMACALSGLSHLVGYPDDFPNRLGGEFDLITGAAALVPVLAALHHRLKTGHGQYIDFSSREAGTTFIGETVLDYDMNLRDQFRCANYDDILTPNNCYRCCGEDMWISISIGNNEEWENLCNISGHPEWLTDNRFCDSYVRKINQELLDKMIETWTIQYTDYEVMALLQNVGVAAIPSFNAEQLSTDPHIRERDIIQEIKHPVIGKIKALGVPWKISDRRPGISPSPLLGEDNQYVFSELLGISGKELKQLEEEEVIY